MSREALTKMHCLYRFFTFLLFLFLLHTLGISMFRFVAALCRDETVMAVAGSAFFLVLILLGGFLLSAGLPLRTDQPNAVAHCFGIGAKANCKLELKCKHIWACLLILCHRLTCSLLGIETISAAYPSWIRDQRPMLQVTCLLSENFVGALSRQSVNRVE